MRTLVVWVDDASGPAWAWAEHMATVAGGRLVAARPGGAALLSVADHEDADLVVVGSRSVIATPAVGAGEYLAHRSRRPFAVVPPDAAARAPRRLAIGMDGSPAAAEAVAWCARVGKALGATAVAVDVIDPPGFLAAHGAEIREQVEHDLAREWTEPLVTAGVKVTRVVVESHDRSLALLDAAAEQGADAIVLGARALRGVRLLHHAGVTLEALRHSRLPVITVPTEQGASAACSVPERAGAFVSGGARLPG